VVSVLKLKVDFMAKLSELGFAKGIIVETIVSTLNRNGQANAAPMGAIMENEYRIKIRLFNSSLTFKNLKINRNAVINITSDPEIYYKTAFKEINPHGKLPQEWFEKAEIVNAPRLIMAEATIEASVVDMVPISAEKTEATFDVKLINATEAPPKAHCRALSAIIEAIVHATRVKNLINDKQQQKTVAKLLHVIDDCSDVVNRVAPNTLYSEIMADLTKRIQTWRTQSESLR
jgi:hypothetical protein